MVTHCSLQAKARLLFGEESRLPCFCLLCILSSLLRMVFHLQPVQATMKDWLLCELGIAVNFLNLKVNKLNILGYLLVTTRFSASLHCNSTLGTRGFSHVRREFSVLAKGQHIFGRRQSREKNLWHGAVLFTVPVDLCAFLSDYIYANQIESLQLWSYGPAHEEVSKDPHCP